MVVFEQKFAQILISALFAIVLVLAATFVFLAKGLPDETVDPLKHPSLKFNFGFGSGKIFEDQILVDKFANGYALLTSGPVSIKANSFRVLRFTWRPAGPAQEAAFFWRRSDDAKNVIRTDITIPGFNLADLTTEADWRGEITEFGFLIAGKPGETIEIGKISLESDSIRNRLQLTWHAWTVFEEWSQKSINFLNGGESHQFVSLSVLVIAWLIVTISLLWLLSVFGRKIDLRQIAVAGSILFLVGWILLDLRWTSNNLQQIQRSLQSHWHADDQQRLSMALDGEIYHYSEKLKSNILDDKTARILIIGDKNAVDYYMLRAKYHLLPHSVNIARQFSRQTAPKSLDFVFFFGQPGGIIKVPGWNQDWQKALTKVESGDWGVVYRVNRVN